MANKGVFVSIPSNISPQPTRAEISAAQLLAVFFNENVKFIPRNNYKTPDFIIGKTKWELKSPCGAGKRNIQHTISNALKQSRYIVFDARYSKMHIAKIKNKLQYEMNKNRRISRLILIDKSGKVVEIFRRV